MNVGDGLRRARRKVLDEHLRLYLDPTSTPQGMFFLTTLLRHPGCGHARFVVDWQDRKICPVCEHEYVIQRVDAIIEEYEAS